MFRALGLWLQFRGKGRDSMGVYMVQVQRLCTKGKSLSFPNIRIWPGCSVLKHVWWTSSLQVY